MITILSFEIFVLLTSCVPLMSGTWLTWNGPTMQTHNLVNFVRVTPGLHRRYMSRNASGHVNVTCGWLASCLNAGIVCMKMGLHISDCNQKKSCRTADCRRFHSSLLLCWLDWFVTRSKGAIAAIVVLFELESERGELAVNNTASSVPRTCCPHWFKCYKLMPATLQICFPTMRLI